MIAAQTPPERTDTTGDRDLTVRTAKATAAALAVAALAFGIWQVRSVLILLLLALTLAAAIRPGVEWLGRHHVPESVAILLHLLVVGGAVALLVWLAVPPALHQIGHALGQNAIAGVAHRPGRRSSRSRAHLAPAAPPPAPHGDAAPPPGRDLWAEGGRSGRRDLLHARRHLVLRLGARLDHQAAHALAPESKRDKARETYLALDRRLGAYTRLRF